ncbi:MAG: hypothetical protein ACTHW4_07855 [Actinomycetales bacterium]
MDADIVGAVPDLDGAAEERTLAAGSPAPLTPLVPGGLVLPGVDLTDAPACGPDGC